MEALPSLGTMRVFVRSKAAIIEAVGVFGGYSETGPFFNVQTDTLDMHIFPAEIASIYAVEKRGHDSEYVTHSFQFFDRQGDAGFKAFLWENYPQVPPPTSRVSMSWPGDWPPPELGHETFDGHWS